MERYETYKDSGVEWIGEIPEGWEYGRLKQRNSIAGRIGWQGLTSDEYCDEGPYLITGVNFANGVIDWDTCVHITDERWEEASQIQIAEGDLLITKDGTVGKVAIVENLHQRASLNSGVMVVRPTTGKQTTRFLYWLLQSGVFWGWFADTNSGNSTIIHLYQGDFLNFDYYLPSVAEQQAIVNYLDTKTAEIDALIADCEREVGLLREYRKAVISEAVTKGLDPGAPMKDSGVEWIGEIPKHWDSGKILRHARLESGHTPSRLRPEWWIEEECTIPWITTQDVHKFRDGRITSIDDTELHVSQIGLDNSSARWLPAGTVALSRTASVGFSVVMAKPMASSQDFADWVPDESLDSLYLLYSLRSMEMVFKQLQMGSTHKTIYMPDIMKLAVAYPPIEEQKAIVAYLNAKTVEIDSLIEAKQSMADKLREYRKSLISEAVTGKFKVPGIQG